MNLNIDWPVPKLLQKYNNNNRRTLKNGEPFILYAERAKYSRNFYALGIKENYFGYCDDYNKRRATEFMLLNEDYEWGIDITPEMVKGLNMFGLYYDKYYEIGQRMTSSFGKGIFSPSPFDKFKGLKEFVYNETDKGYRIRFDIDHAGDSWISENEDDLRVWMRDKVDNRAILYFVSFSNEYGKPGITTDYPVFSKAEMSK